jgi:hypothetical protein
MGTTLKQIARYLQQDELKYEVNEENQTILTGFQTENVENFWLLITLSEEGEYLQITAPQLLNDIKASLAPVIHKALLNLSLQTKMVRWAYDPMDGEISALVDLPIMDSLLTERQFSLCLEALVRVIDEVAMPRLKNILRTGIDPQELELGERILLDLETSYPGSIACVEQALKRRKRLAVVSKRENRSNGINVWQKFWDVVVSGKG